MLFNFFLNEPVERKKEILSSVYFVINLHQIAIFPYPTTGRVAGKSIFSAVGRLGWSWLTWSWAKFFVSLQWVMQDGGGFIAGKFGIGWESSITLTPFTWPIQMACSVDTKRKEKESFGENPWINYRIVIWIFSPILALPKASRKRALAGWGLGGIFIRRLGGWPSLSRFLLTCSTGNTRRRFFGNLERA